MQVNAWEWLNLLVRWFHLIAGIGWIGSSFYFMWLDASLEVPNPKRAGVEGELWMVHSGGFYQVERRLIGPGSMPKTLHWFKYEALFTWISGILLLAVVYYISGGVYLIDKAKMDLPIGGAVGISLGAIALSWIVYDTLWASRLADSRPKLTTALTFLWLFGIVLVLSNVFSGRAAFIHVGAILGTVMVANVWHRILPGQQRMIDATREGRQPDLTHGVKAKRRSVHNSYATLPVVFMMFSNHYPELYAHEYNWLILCLMIFLGAVIRHIMILETKNKNGWPWAVPAVVTLVGVVTLTAMHPGSSGSGGAAPTANAATAKVADDAILAIVKVRCQPCHSSIPTDDVFTAAPNGVKFEHLDQVRSMADRIKMRVIDTKTMPLANKTAMTDQERETLGQWLSQP